MRDGVWDRVSRSARKTNHNNSTSRLFGASKGHLTAFRSGLGFRSIRSQAKIALEALLQHGEKREQASDDENIPTHEIEAREGEIPRADDQRQEKIGEPRGNCDPGWKSSTTIEISPPEGDERVRGCFIDNALVCKRAFIVGH